jgi:general secretion pathway protein D
MKLNKLLTLLLLVMFSSVEAKKIAINFSNLDISEFVKMVSKITKKNILITVPISGKVDFVADHGIEEGELFSLLQSVLSSKGFTLVENDGFLTTVRVVDASKEAPPLKRGEMGQIHTQVMPVESADANTLSAQLRFLLSKSGKIVVSRENNAFIVTDFPRNTQLIQALIKQLDQKKRQSIAFIPLEHVKASSIYAEFVKITNSLYNQKIVQQKIGVFKNDATNMIILVARDEQLAKLKKYLVLLDKPDKITKQRMGMITLKNADAEVVMKLLNEIITKKNYAKDAVKPSISADKELNALIFIASGEEIDEFTELIGDLDKERQQVYVQARILEISRSDAESLGAEYGVGTGGVVGGTLFNLTANLNGSAPDFVTSATAAQSLGLSISDIVMGININLLQSNGAANTLSEPSILCINNLESSIYVGQTASILSRTTQGADSTSLASNQFTREDIGLTLKIKPRISSDLKVSLDVEAKLEDVVPGSAVGLPTTTKREIKTTAIVKDGERVIIGGLIRKKESVSESRIPLLGSIPLLGALFRSTNDSFDEVNLVIILQPYILGKSEDLTALRERLKKLHALEQKFIDKALDDLEKEKNRND